MSDARSTTLDLADGLRGVPIPFAGKLSRIPSRALYCNGATPLRSSYPELHEVMYIEDDTCDISGVDTVNMDDTSEINVGDAVEGPGIPIGAVVFSVDSATQISLSVPTTAVATNITLRFYPWGNGDGSTTFDLPDLRGAFLQGTGSHGTETKANGNAFSGPAVGAFKNDQMQDHDFYQFASSSSTSPINNSPSNTPRQQGDSGNGNYRYRICGSSSSQAASQGPTNGGMKEFNGQGTPRTGDETRPFAAGVNYIIFY